MARPLAAAAAAAVLLLVDRAGAANDVYTGQSSTTFSDGANWSLGSAPGAANVAVFNRSSYANQPTVTGPDSVLGLAFGDTSGTAAGAITIGGAGPLTVGTGGVIAYAGSLGATINAPLILSAGGSTITNNAAATLTLANVSSGSSPITIAGSGNVLFSGATGTTDGSGYLSTTGGIIINSTGKVDFNVSLSPVTGGVTVNSGTASFDYTDFYNGPFVANATYTVNSAGTLAINAAHALGNYFGVNLIVNGGTVIASHEQYIAGLTMTGGTVKNGTTTGELRTAVDGTPINVVGSSSAATISTNLATIGTRSFAFNVASGTSGAADLTVSGQLIGGGGLTKSGAGTLALSNNYNTFTGNVTVNGGTLVSSGRSYYTDSGGLGAVNTPGRSITVNAGATLSLTSNNTFGNGVGVDVSNLPTVTATGGTLASTQYNPIGNVVLNSGATMTHSAASGGYSGFQFLGSVTVGGTSGSTIAVTNGGQDHLGPNTDFVVAATGDANADLTVTATLRNQSTDFGGAAGGLTKDGTGTMLLAAGNTFSGNVTVNGGNLIAGGPQGSLNNGGLGNNNVAGRTITVNTGGTLTFATNNTFGGGTLDDGTGTINPNLPTLAINGGTVTALNQDVAVYAGTYTPLGNVMLAGGTLTSQLDTVDPSPSDPVNYPGTRTDDVYYGAYQLLGNVTVTGSAASTIAAPRSSIHLGANTTFNVAKTGASGADLVVSAGLIDESGDFEDANGNVLAGGLTKTGAGKMALNGINAYFGPTVVSGGTLVVNGTLGQASIGGTPLGSSPVTVNAGAVLGGTGTISGTVAVAGTITGGSGATTTDSAGTLTTGDQAWNGSGGYVAKVGSAGTTNDLLVMSGLTINGTFTVTALALGNAAPVPASTRLVIAVDSNTSQGSIFTNALAAGLLVLSPASTVTFSDGGKPMLAEVDTGSGIELVLQSATAAPEPASLLLAGMAVAPLALGRRRRRL